MNPTDVMRLAHEFTEQFEKNAVNDKNRELWETSWAMAFECAAIDLIQKIDMQMYTSAKQNKKRKNNEN